MNSVLHRETDNERQERQGDREINLSAAVILGIFFSLAMLCAVFFGFGYSLGRKSAGVVAAGGTTAVQVPPPFGGVKPAAGSTVVQQGGATVAVPLDASSAAPKVPVSVPSEEPIEAAPTESASSKVIVADSGKLDTGITMVQVAAVSHQEDADLLVTALKRRGYAVAIHNEPQDKLLHVQVGPFASHKDADAMRQKLLADGFNAIVKEQK